MRKLAMILLFVLLVTVFTSGNPIAADIDLPKTEKITDIKKIIASGTLRVAICQQDYYPFYTTLENGVIQGLDYDMATEIAGHMGVKPHFVRTAKTWDRTLELVAAGDVDIAISGLTITLTRALKVQFTDPYVTMPSLIVINRRFASGHGKSYLKRLKKKGVTITTVRGTAQQEFARLVFPDASIMTLSTEDECLQAVIGNKADAFFSTYELLYGHLLEKPALSLYLKAMRLENPKDHIAIAVHQESRHLHNWLNLYIKWRGLDNYSIEDVILQHPSDTAAKKNILENRQP